MGGLSLPQLLQAEAQAGVRKSHKAVIMVFLPGGPPHQDMWEIKTEAPSEIRGPLQPISTSIPGIQICELFPKIAQRMDRFVPIRSIVGASGRQPTLALFGFVFEMVSWAKTCADHRVHP